MTSPIDNYLAELDEAAEDMDGRRYKRDTYRKALIDIRDEWGPEAAERLTERIIEQFERRLAPDKGQTTVLSEVVKREMEDEMDGDGRKWEKGEEPDWATGRYSLSPDGK